MGFLVDDFGNAFLLGKYLFSELSGNLGRKSSVFRSNYAYRWFSNDYELATAHLLLH